MHVSKLLLTRIRLLLIRQRRNNYHHTNYRNKLDDIRWYMHIKFVTYHEPCPMLPFEYAQAADPWLYGDANNRWDLLDAYKMHYLPGIISNNSLRTPTIIMIASALWWSMIRVNQSYILVVITIIKHFKLTYHDSLPAVYVVLLFIFNSTPLSFCNMNENHS